VSRFTLTVTKVGGSLLDWPLLPRRLSAFLTRRRDFVPSERMVLIAGGGAAADVVRALDRTHELGGQRAHELALHALDLTAHVLAQLVPGSTVVVRIAALDDAWSAGSIPIIAPRRALRELEQSGIAPLPASWAVTSDSISARIAVALRAGCLVLLKSAPLPANATRAEAARLGLVDPMLPNVAQPLTRVEYLNLREPSLDPRLLPP
jgi:aspartokinase-like uncharacterized kinase